jgi:hypothetical protein
MAAGKTSGPATVVLSALGMAAGRGVVSAYGWEVVGTVLLVVALAALAIGACVLIWRALRALLWRIDRALPDHERDRREELEGAYMKASLERWVQSGTSGDPHLDARFAAMRTRGPGVVAAPPARLQPSPVAVTGSEPDDPRTVAFIEALARKNPRLRAGERP